MSDDGLGIYIVREIKKKVSTPDIDIVEASTGGIKILDFLEGYKQAFLVDATVTGKGKPGEIYRADTSSLVKTLHTNSTHDLNLAEALTLGAKIGMALPQDICIYAVEARDVTSFSENCSPDVKKAIQRCAGMILKELDVSQK